MRTYLILAAAMVAMIAQPAEAYVGPGLGLGAIGVVIGLFMTLIMAAIAFVWMPVKRMLTRGKTASSEMPEDA